MARASGWRIVLRIEDLDGPRVKPGVIDLTIDLLRWIGIDWDSGPIIQSSDLGPYSDAMSRLAHAALAYPSDLSRAQIEAAASAPQDGTGEVRFPPELRPPLASRAFDDPATSWRFATPDARVDFVDDGAGPQTHSPASTVGDFVVWTKRGQPSYQLAVVVDDARQHVTRIVRGNDLLDSAARQVLLYRALGLSPIPTYCHLPLVRGADGKRLAKRHGDTRLDSYRSRGVRPERLIGLLARWSGPPELRTSRIEMSASEFLRVFRLDTMPREDVVFTPEDEEWLCRS
jgi:glutamyl-tRNA synthetase